MEHLLPVLVRAGAQAVDEAGLIFNNFNKKKLNKFFNLKQ
jgi:hypothetical protein